LHPPRSQHPACLELTKTCVWWRFLM